MFCTNCGENIDEDSKFCGFCGATVNAAPVFHSTAASELKATETNEPVSPSPELKPAKKKGKMSFKGIVALILALALIGGAITFAVTYESSEKAIENIIEGALSGKEEELDKYSNAYVTISALGISRGLKKEMIEENEGNLADSVEYSITSNFNYYFEDDDYDIDWEIVAKSEVDLDDEKYENLDIMKKMIDMGFISSVFHPQILMDAVEYEIKFTAQELDDEQTANMKFLLVNYNMRWYLLQYYRV